jgi:NhaP-type Na+/H+ or K+/H+ antiporter
MIFFHLNTIQTGQGEKEQDGMKVALRSVVAGILTGICLAYLWLLLDRRMHRIAATVARDLWTVRG